MYYSRKGRGIAGIMCGIPLSIFSVYYIVKNINEKKFDMMIASIFILLISLVAVGGSILYLYYYRDDE